jgi:hypothetical protein
LLASLGSFYSVSGEPGEGWLAGWSHRKQHLIQGSTAGVQTNYQMKIVTYPGSGTDYNENAKTPPEGHVYLGLPGEDLSQWKISVNSSIYASYGLAYPLTYVFNISTPPKVYCRFLYGQSWTLLPNKTENDFFNGINAVRFDASNNRAYVSVAFSEPSSSIYLNFTDTYDRPIEARFIEIAKYYDNRKAVVVATADDWTNTWDSDFQWACYLFRSRNLWLTAAIVTAQAPWASIQSMLDAGYIEPASHSYNHPSLPYADYDLQIGRSKQDIIGNLILPALNRIGSTEYVWAWIEPYGNATDATCRQKLGEYKYLCDRSYYAPNDTVASWDQTNGLYERIGSSVIVDWDLTREQYNSKFDQVYNSGGIYHILFHPWADPSYHTSFYEHLDYIKERKDVWYAGFGHLYVYHFAQERGLISVSPSPLGEARADFGDVRFTDSNGTRLLDYWMEEKVIGDYAVFWVEVPNIPASPYNTTIYIYYGRPDATTTSNGDNTFLFFDDFTSLFKEIHADNAANASITTVNFLAENIEYDSATGKYWWIFADGSTNPYGIRLASSTNPNGPWTVESSQVLTSGIAGQDYDAPCLKKFGDYWYIYYERDVDHNICVRKSTTVNSGYGSETQVLSVGASGSWDAWRVGESYIFLKDSTYYMLYMGMNAAFSDPDAYERTGYATSSTPDGTFTKWSGNPLPAFYFNTGHCQTTDPFAFLKDGTWYVGITFNQVANADLPWMIGFLKTTDFQTFEACAGQPALGLGASGSWDDYSAFRGAVSEFGGTYYLSYTGYDGANFRMGETTLQFNVTQESLDLNKWEIQGQTWQIDVTDHTLKGSNTQGALGVILSKNQIGVTDKYMIEAKIKAQYGLTPNNYQQGLMINDVKSNEKRGGYWLDLAGYDCWAIMDKSGGYTLSSPDTTFNANLWHEYKFAKLGTTHKLWVDDLLKVNRTYSWAVAPRYVGALITYSAAWAKYDDYIVRKYVEPEPRHGTTTPPPPGNLVQIVHDTQTEFSAGTFDHTVLKGTETAPEIRLDSYTQFSWIFQDDDISGWTYFTKGAFAVAAESPAGQIHLSALYDGGASYGVAQRSDVSIPSQFVVEYRVYFDSIKPSGVANPMINQPTGACARFDVQNPTAGLRLDVFTDRIVSFYREGGTESYPTIAYFDVTTNLSQWYTLRFECNFTDPNLRVQVYRDGLWIGELKADTRNSIAGNLVRAGLAYSRGSASGTAEFHVDYVKVGANTTYFYDVGTYTSGILYLNATSFGTLTWTEIPIAPILIEFETRTSPDGSTWEEWRPVLNGSTIHSSPNRYFQYRATLHSGSSPTLTSVKITYQTEGTPPNTPPVASNLAITPPFPYTTDDLVGSYTYFDAEGTPESGTEIRWYKDGVLQPVYNDALTVSSSSTTTGEVWHFTVRPSDGEDFGDLKTSPSVTIAGAPPPGNLVQIVHDTQTEFSAGTFDHTVLKGTETAPEIRLDSYTQFSWIFQDDDISGWTYFTKGAFAVAAESPAGQIHLSALYDGGASYGVAQRSDVSIPSQFVVEYRVYFDSIKPSGVANPMINQPTGACARFDVQNPTAGLRLDVFTDRIVSFYREGGTESYPTIAYFDVTTNLSQWYTLRFECNFTDPNLRVQVYRDGLWIGELKADTRNSIAGNLVRAGLAYSRGSASGTAEFHVDYVKVGANTTYFYDVGTYTSGILYLNATSFGTLTWTEIPIAPILIEFETRTSPDGSTWEEWRPVLNGSTIHSSPNRYFQYRATLHSGSSPTLTSVKITYQTGENLV